MTSPDWTRRALLRRGAGSLALSGVVRAAEPAKEAVAPAAAVVSTAGVEAYQRAVEGIVSALGETKTAKVALDPSGASKQLAQALEGAAVVVAVGVEARAALTRSGTALPIVSTMLLVADADESNASGETPKNSVGTVYLDVELTKVASELEILFPAKKRLGILMDGDKRSAPNQAVLTKLGELGYQTHLASCARKKEIGRALVSLRGKSDFVICLPSNTLYDSESVTALVESSLENRLPVVGFSPGLVRAGAPVGIFPDFFEVGKQAGEMALAVLAGRQFTTDETPRKLAVVTNPRSLRLLGLKIAK